MSSRVRPTVSVIVPAFNEEDCLPQLFARLDTLCRRNPAYRFEVLLVDNASTDGTAELAAQAQERYPWLSVLGLLQNRGTEGAIIAGLDHVQGDSVVFLNADLEDPPELIDTFLKLWSEGASQVVGEVRSRAGYSTSRRFFTKWYYKIAVTLSAGVIAENVSDFRLIDKSIYEELRRMRERERLNRGLLGYIGGPVVKVPYDRDHRGGGNSSFRPIRIFLWACRQLLSFTTVPLRAIAITGVVFACGSCSLLLWSLVQTLVAGVPFAGFGTLMAFMLAAFALNFLALGVIAEYLAVVFTETKARSLYLVAYERPSRGGHHELE